MTKIGRISVTRNSQVKVMGILNVSPESFYKDSIKTTTKIIASAAITMQQEGAQLIDIGAMSTAPYLGNTISVEKEVKRLKKAIKIVRESCDLAISVDTPRAVVAREAVKLGADCLNDITGLKYDRSFANIIAESKLPVILGAYGRRKKRCHSKPTVTGKMSSTISLLKESLSIAKNHGIKNDKIIIDPCIGFFRAYGKNQFFTRIQDMPWYVRDIDVISRLRDFERNFSNPVCISISRKSFIGELLNLRAEDRLFPSLVLELISAMNGAKIIRTHNVMETVRVLTICRLIC